MILNFAGDLVDDLSLRLAFLMISDPLRDVIDAFNLLEMPLRVFGFFVYGRHFCHFLMHF